MRRAGEKTGTAADNSFVVKTHARLDFCHCSMSSRDRVTARPTMNPTPTIEAIGALQPAKSVRKRRWAWRRLEFIRPRSGGAI